MHFKEILAYFSTVSTKKFANNPFFLKSKLDMQNGINQKLDLVIIFASLAWFDQNSKSERQVRFAAPFRGRQTAYRPVNASPPCASLPKTFYVSYLLQCWNFRKFAAQLFLLHNFVCASNLMCFWNVFRCTKMASCTSTFQFRQKNMLNQSLKAIFLNFMIYNSDSANCFF